MRANGLRAPLSTFCAGPPTVGTGTGTVWGRRRRRRRFHVPCVCAACLLTGHRLQWRGKRGSTPIPIHGALSACLPVCIMTNAGFTTLWADADFRDRMASPGKLAPALQDGGAAQVEEEEEGGLLEAGAGNATLQDDPVPVSCVRGHSELDEGNSCMLDSKLTRRTWQSFRRQVGDGWRDPRSVRQPAIRPANHSAMTVGLSVFLKSEGASMSAYLPTETTRASIPTARQERRQASGG